MKKEIFGLAFGLALVMVVAIGAIALPAMAAESSSEGSFTPNNAAPGVTSVELYNVSHANTEGSMTPQTEYAVKIIASDPNTLNDIDYITVVIKEQNYGGPTDDPMDQATYKYTKGSGWSIVGPGVSWLIDATNSVVPGDLTQLSGTWWLHFTPGKVAREATWDITVTATDYAPATTAPVSDTGLSMQWYGELAAEDTTFSFGPVDLNTPDQQISIPDDHKVDVKAIANGNYKLESKSANWIGQTSGETATLDWDATLESGHFQLENDGDGTVADTYIVEDDYNTITDCGSLSAPTNELGNSNPVYVWISLAADGFVLQEYKGTYNVQIAPASV